MTRPLPMRPTTIGAALLTAGCLSLAATTAAAAATGSAGQAPAGDSNSGDVWLDNAGQPAGPGHEMDPHLSCTDINLWGNGLADSGGAYSIDGWPPSGSQEVVLSSRWSYKTAAGGDQVIDVIPVTTLIDNAVAAGDSPQNGNGFHFKLDLSQDPQKHKTFWVDCPTPAAGAGAAASATPTPKTTPTGTPAPVVGAAGAVQGTSTTAPGGAVHATTPSTSSPSGSVLGLSTTSTSSPAAGPRGGVEAATAGAASTPLTGTRLPLLLSALMILAGVAAVVVSRKARQA